MIFKTEHMHRGEWIKRKIKERGFTLDMLCDELHMARTSLWRMTKAEDLPYFKMKIVADAIGVDLRNDFPDAASLYEKKVKDYKSLYQQSLEEIAELKEELAKYKRSEEDNRDKNGTASH